MKRFLCLRLALALVFLPVVEAAAAVRVVPAVKTGVSIGAKGAPLAAPGAAALPGGLPGAANLSLGSSLSAVDTPDVRTARPAGAEAALSGAEAARAETRTKGSLAAADQDGEKRDVPAVGPSGPVAGEERTPGRKGDLGPAGPHKRVTYEDLAQLPVAWKDLDRVPHTYENLRLILSLGREGRDSIFKYLEEHPDQANDIFEGMFLSLESVLDSNLPGAERNRIAVSLSHSYASLFAEIVRHPLMSDAVRTQARDNLRHFHTRHNLVTELLRKREAEHKLARLRRLVNRITGEEETEASQGAGAEEDGREALDVKKKPPWRVLERSEKYTEDSEQSFSYSLDGYAETLDTMLFYTEKLWRRFSLAHNDGFTRRFIEARAKGLSDYLDDVVLPKIRSYSVSIPRYAIMSLGQTYLGFNNSVRPDHLWVPDHPDLNMEVSNGLVTVRARFETDIASDEVVRVVKESIEKNWNGTFLLDGRRVAFRSEITIVRVAPSGFSPGALRIIEDEVSHAMPRHIALSREFGYDVPAHEFGHILGLPDEYVESYDGIKREGSLTSNPGSIMGSSAYGIVQPRLLEKAFRLLAQKSVRQKRQ